MVSFSNGSLSGEVSNKRPLENGYVPKYKPRRVSAIRDFPPGCGGNAVPLNLTPEENGGCEADVGEATGVESLEMNNAVVANGVGSSQMANRIEPEEVGNSEMADKMESNGVDTAEVPKLVRDEIKDFETQNAAVSSGVKDSNMKAGCLLDEAVNITVDVDMTESLDALVGQITANANVDEKLLLETGSLGIELPNAVEFQSYEAVKNPRNDMRSDSSNEETEAGGQKMLKELNKVNHLALVKKSDMEAAKSGASVDNNVLLGHSQALFGSGEIEATIRPKDRYCKRKVSAVRDFPPNCGRNVSLPTEEVKLMVTAENGCLDAIEKVEVTPVETHVLHDIRVRKESTALDDDDGAGRGPLGEMTEVNVEFEHTNFEENDSSDLRQSIIQRTEAREAGIMSNAVAVTSNHKTDGNPGSLTFTEEKDFDACDEHVHEITPISIVRAVPDTSDSDSAEPVGKDIVVYSPIKNDEMKPSHSVSSSADEADRKVVHGLLAASNNPLKKGKTVSSNPDGGTSGVKKTKPNSLWRKKAKVVAKKSVKAPGLPSKKLKKVHVSNAEKGIGALVLADDEGHNGDSPTKSPPGKKSRDLEVTLPPFGPNSSGHGDARNRVRDTLRVFNAICRKLLQHEEANSKPEEEGNSKKKLKRIDLLAAKAIKERGKEVNTGKQILGEVPGVEVGDEFQYRVELAVVGIHRLYQAGIDSMKLSNGVQVATSIVSSGAYADDLENADVLVYSGQGGNVVGNSKQKQQPQDQKLEKGNLALKNSIDEQTPVRVVRGWKEKAVDPLDPKPKLVMTYVYDGLYTVKRYWTEMGPHGKQVFMFELKRNPGQPELAWKELKKSNKSRFRPGVCVTDISLGKEPFAISAVNTIDDDKPPPFKYISKMMYPNWHNPIAPAGCSCTGRCSDSKKCRCAVRNGGEIPYNRNGALVETKLLVYECGPHCKCPPSCYNRVSQRGIRLKLEIFKTESRGWGVRALTSIPSGSFVCEYAGELLEDTEAEQKIGSDEYLFDIGQNLSDSSLKPEDQAISAELVGDGGYTIDACQFGNIGRFINHSCSPNLYAQNVIYDHDDMKMPHIMLFAMENIPPLKELTYHYNYSVDQIRDSKGNIKVKKCYCGTAQCTGRMY